jgi:hypothetical protein
MNDRKFNLGDVVRVTGGGKRGVVVNISQTKRRGTKITVMPTDMVTSEFLWSFSTGLAGTIAVFDLRSFVSSPQNLSLMFMGRADLYFAAKGVYEKEKVTKKAAADYKLAAHLQDRKDQDLLGLVKGDILTFQPKSSTSWFTVTFHAYAKSSGRIGIVQYGKHYVVDPADLTRP